MRLNFGSRPVSGSVSMNFKKYSSALQDKTISRHDYTLSFGKWRHGI